MADAETLTQQAIAAHRAGDTSSSIRLFAQAVTATPTHETAWLWLAACLIEPGEQRYCLDRALACNPDSAAARRALTYLATIRPERPVVLIDLDPPATAVD